MATKKVKPSVKRPIVTINKAAPKISTVKIATGIKKFLSCNCKTDNKMPDISALIAEFIGTFLFVAIFFAITVAGTSIIVSFALIGIVLVVGNISGAHLNPAVTIGAWVTRKMCSLCAIAYMFAQALGGIAAWSVLTSFLDGAKTATSTAGASLLSAADLTIGNVIGKEWYVFFAELLGTIILAFGIATALRAKHNRVTAALTQGFAILVALTIAGSLTAIFLSEQSTSLIFLNPVLAFVAGGVSWNVWPIAIYILAPVIGAVIGFILQDFLQSQKLEVCDCEIKN